MLWTAANGTASQNHFVAIIRRSGLVLIAVADLDIFKLSSTLRNSQQLVDHLPTFASRSSHLLDGVR